MTSTNDIVNIKVRDGIAVLTFDVPGEKQNTLSEKSAKALQAAFERVESDAAIRGAVLISGKSDFIAGADISMLQACTSADQVEKLSRDMQEQLSKMEKSKKPVVAAIHGVALGGGLEVALACHWRIATDSPKTQLGLPEVMLGLLPGGGGTQRLPRLIGLQGALDMLLTGKNIRAVKAKRMGLVDQVTIPYGLEDAAVTACQRLIAGELKRPDRKQKLDPQGKVMEAALEENAAGRALVFHQARATVMEKTLGLYPAPLAILDVVEAGYERGIDAGFAAEAKRFGGLAMTNEAHSLMHLFFGQTSLKKNRYGTPAKKLSTVGVLGAGLMGSGIADVTANKGVRTLMKDVSPESLARGQKAIWEGLNKRVKSRSLSSFERERIASNVVGKLDYAGFNTVDLVIEAVFEDLKIKHKVLKECEENLRDDAVFASNTSALPISEIAKASKRPENVVGMHYFSPVQKMPLLEVIVTDKTSKEAAAVAVEAGILQGKTVIVVKDGPGFYTTRILGPVMEEAAVLALEGVDLHAIDQLMKETGFPVGPITLLDEVGIDVAAHVAKDMAPFFEKRFGKRDSSALEAMVKQGFLGRKANKGFFLYGKEQPKPFSLEGGLSKAKKMAGHLPFIGDRVSDIVGGKGKPYNPGALEILAAHGAKHGSKKSYDKKELQDRVLLRMVNEAAQCLQEGILDNAVDGDIGAVFGLGFPPMTGGPFRYVDTVGAGVVVATLERFAAAMGPRFTPCQLLVDQAKAGRKFHKA